jgi:hypothetical protein
MRTRHFAIAPLAAAATLALAGTALAAPAVALTGDKTLVMFDTETLAVSGTMDVTGVDALVGIDVRPADMMLYGVAADGTIVTIDTATGATTTKSTLSENLPAGVAAIVDFNPAADRLRYMGTDGTNLRVNVDDGMVTVDGSLAYESADMHAGETPAIVAAAYINSYGKPEATAMYDIDATIVALIQQAPPNDGVLKAIGKLGIEGTANYAFDVATTSEMANTAYLVAGATLYTVALDSGAATAVGEISGTDAIRDIAILP